MKRIMKEFSVCLAGAALGSMLAGFTPAEVPFPSEWRGTLTPVAANSRYPLSHASHGALSASLSGRFRPEEARMESFVPSAEGSFLELNDGSVSILTADGPRPVATTRGSLNPLLPLLADDLAKDVGEDELLLALLEEAALAGEGEILDAGGRPLRWDALFTGSGVCRTSVTITSPQPRGMSAYRSTVVEQARKYNMDPALIFAIMQIESGFNPTLISGRQAHGLMQVVPHTAGNEVHRWLGREGQPTRAELLNPEYNIRYGVIYIHLLRSHHLNGIANRQSLDYCTIAAYNGGSGAVLRLFGPNKEAAVAHINALGPEAVLRTLTQSFPARETRQFVSKVLAARGRFVSSGV